MLLSKRAIIDHLKLGNVVISPFNEKNLGNCSYDVTIGPYFFREKDRWNHGRMEIYNPFSKTQVEEVWGQEAEEATLLKDFLQGRNASLRRLLEDSIGPEDRIILLAPGEMILAHTEEFIGGQKCVTTMMKARSSIGRNFLSVCKCAGWGDVGYVNRWTMEITNNSRFYHIPLVVGRRIAQLAFFQVEPIRKEDDYSQKSDSKYQSGVDLGQIMQDWKPQDMLPKMWKDREIRR